MPCLIDLCTRLNGLPLATPIVASWLGTLDRSTADDLDRYLPSTMCRRIPIRASALFLTGATIELADGERATLRRLAVLRGQFDFDAAMNVVGGAMGRRVRK